MLDLTAAERDALRASYARVAETAPQVAALFYDQLFEAAPHTRDLFPRDLSAQGTKLMNTLGSIVARIHDQALLQPMLEDLARRHVGYGVRPEHFETLGQVLLSTLQRTLGPRFTPEVEAAWIRAYAGLSQAMLDAAWPDRNVDHRS